LGENALRREENIITELSNPLPGNSSVNTVQHATTEAAVFFMSVVTTQQWIMMM
jgi:hypothetical protein